MNLLSKSLLGLGLVIGLGILLLAFLLSRLFPRPQAPTTIIVERPSVWGWHGYGLPGWGERRGAPPPPPFHKPGLPPPPSPPAPPAA